MMTIIGILTSSNQVKKMCKYTYTEFSSGKKPVEIIAEWVSSRYCRIVNIIDFTIKRSKCRYPFERHHEIL